MKKISIVDYGMGNTKSLVSSFRQFGVDALITKNKKIIDESDLIILPGVGAFPQAMKLLKKNKLDALLKKKFKDGTKIIGICLGMQLLFESSDEIKKTKGLGFIKGNVTSLKRGFNIGWSKIKKRNVNTFIEKSNKGNFYFIHSFKCNPKFKKVITSISNFKGENFCSSVSQKNIHGFQFHPEKSRNLGLKIIKNILV